MKPCLTVPFIIVLLFLAAAAPSVAHAQDLIERVREKAQDKLDDKAQVSSRITRNGLSLTIDPGLTLADQNRSTETKVGYNSNLSFGFTCGQFNWESNLRHTFDDVMDRGLDQLINYAEGKLVSSGLTLLCNSAPSMCDAFKFYSLQAGELLKWNYDKCADIEKAVDTPERRSRAAAFDRCMSDKAAKGVPMSQAISECQGSPFAYVDLLGKTVREFSPFEEVKSLFKLDEKSASDMDLLFGKRRVTAEQVQGEADPEGMDKLYQKIKDEYSKRWLEVLKKFQDGKPVSDAELAKLLPYPDVFFIRNELRALVYMEPEDRAIILESLVSQAARVELVKRLLRYQRLLQAAMQMPGSEQNPKAMEEYRRAVEKLQQSIERLDREMQEKRETQAKVGQTVNAINSQNHVSASEFLKRQSQDREFEAKKRNLPRYGQSNPLGNYVPQAIQQATKSESVACPPCVVTTGWGAAKPQAGK